jgi:hypothetical protein
MEEFHVASVFIGSLFNQKHYRKRFRAIRHTVIEEGASWVNGLQAPIPQIKT